MRNSSDVRRSLLWLLAAAVAIPACSDSSSGGGPVSSYVVPAPFAVGVSAAGLDQLQSAVADLAGTGFYAAGFVAADHLAATPKFVTVVKILNSGALDNSFDGDGIVTTALATVGGNDDIDIALQSDGKILVSTTFPVGADRDFAVIRLLTTGAIDTAFAPGAPAGNGIRQFSLSAGASDACRSIAVHPTTDEIFLHGAQLAEGNIPGTATPRTDTDFVVVKLSAAGDLDTVFGNGSGKHMLDINLAGATPRKLQVMSDGTIVASGYTTAFSSGAQPVLYKLTAAGARAVFANNGVFHQFPLALQTEVYGFAVHGDYIVTGGYGRNVGTRNDFVSLRLNWNGIVGPPIVAAGTRDLAWGGSPVGAPLFNPSPDPAIGSNCRGAAALPDGKTLLFGSTGAGNTVGQNAVFAVLDASGFLDFDYGGIPQVFPLGVDGNDQFWGGASHATHAIVVGYFGGGAGGQSALNNDNSYAMVIPIQ